MEIAKRLLDEVKAAKGIKTDYALAKALELPNQRICDYYKGNRVPDEYACMKIAEALGKTLDEVVSRIKIDAEKDETRREAWKRHLKSLGGIAASFMLWGLAMIVSVTMFVTSPAEAAENQEVRSVKFTKLQIMRLPGNLRGVPIGYRPRIKLARLSVL